MDRFLTDDLIFSDIFERSVEGRDRFIEVDRKFREEFGGPELVIKKVVHFEDELLVSGQFEGGRVDISAPTLWRVSFRDMKIRSVMVMRADGQATLPSFAAHVS